MTLQEVWQVCRRSHHHGFPVVQRGQLVGMITEQHLAKLAGQPPQSCIREYMDRQPIGIHPGAVLSDVLYLMDRQHISHLPVTEGRKLVGIITRSDLIHATADELRGVQRPHTRDPSYSVYRTRDPATGEGRLLLPISDATLLPQLLPLAGAIAADKNYEIECLHVITVPPHHAPAQTRVNMQTGIRLLQDARAYFARWQIPVHTQIRVAHQVAPAILEMIQLRQIDLLVMAWLGRERTPQTLFGMVTDSILRESTCDVLLMKPGKMSHAYPQRTRWLIPISGGPNIRRALEFLPSFYTLATAESIILTQVCVSKKKQPRWKRLKQTAIALQDALPCPIESIPLQSAHIAESVKQLAETKECGLVIVGASRESMLQHALHGNIPNAIASGVEGTVLLFQKAPTRKLAGEEGIGARSAERDEVN
jgi:CIC family chloride channel protein